MKINIRSAAILAVLVIFALAILFGISRAYANSDSLIEFDQGLEYQVVKVIDGDTFEVKVGNFPFSRTVTVRMLGIDTPETVDPRKPEQCFGKEASDETKRLLSDRKVRLELESKREVRDKYGRYLAYVYLDNGVFVNEHLLLDGFAREYTFGKAYTKQLGFRDAELSAKQNELGLHFACK